MVIGRLVPYMIDNFLTIGMSVCFSKAKRVSVEVSYYNEEFHNVYCSPSIIRMIKSRRMRWEGHVARMAENNAYRTLVGKPKGKRPVGRPRHRWVNNIKMYHREIGWYGMDWIILAQDRDQWRALVNTVMNLRVPLNAGKFLTSCTLGSFSRRAQLHE
jgi:hypothetical protein